MFNFNLKGLAEWFKLGKNGPIIKKDGDKVQFRNPDDTDFVNVQALDPVDPQDVVTKQYLEDNSDLASFNLNKSLFKNFDYTATSPIQIGTQDMPNKGLAYKILIHVKTAFDGTAPTLEIGETGNQNRLANINLNDLGEGEVYVVTISEIYSGATTVEAFLTPDSSTTGEIDVTVLYTMSSDGAIASSIEQLNTGGSSYGFGLTRTKNNIMGQTFTMVEDGTLDSVSIFVSRAVTGDAPDFDSTIEILDGPTGSVIGTSDTKNINSELSPDPPQELVYTFSSDVNLNDATQYYFRFNITNINSGSSQYVIATSGVTGYPADLYAGGIFYNGGSPTPATDMTFKIEFR